MLSFLLPKAFILAINIILLKRNVIRMSFNLTLLAVNSLIPTIALARIIRVLVVLVPRRLESFGDSVDTGPV